MEPSVSWILWAALFGGVIGFCFARFQGLLFGSLIGAGIVLAIALVLFIVVYLWVLIGLIGMCAMMFLTLLFGVWLPSLWKTLLGWIVFPCWLKSVFGVIIIVAVLTLLVVGVVKLIQNIGGGGGGGGGGGPFAGDGFYGGASGR
jgi:hypothetical protein